MLEAVAYLRATHPDVLANYPGDSVRYMLDAIRTTSSSPRPIDDAGIHLDNVTCAGESTLRIVDSLFRFNEHELLNHDVTSGGNETESWRNSTCAADCARWFMDVLRLLLGASEGVSSEGPGRTPDQVTDSEKLRRNLSAAADAHVDIDRRPKGFLSDTKLIKKTSHILHYIGIVIVGLFALQVSSSHILLLGRQASDPLFFERVGYKGKSYGLCSYLFRPSLGRCLRITIVRNHK